MVLLLVNNATFSSMWPISVVIKELMDLLLLVLFFEVWGDMQTCFDSCFGYFVKEHLTSALEF